MIVRIARSSKKYSFHKIIGPASPGSMASYLQLKEEYQKLDPQCRTWRMGKRVWLNFRNKILKQKQKEAKGNLICAYCGSDHLVLNFHKRGLPNNKKATLDHIIPKSKGGSEYSLSNLAVSCHKCNSKKKDLMPEDFNKKKISHKT